MAPLFLTFAKTYRPIVSLADTIAISWYICQNIAKSEKFGTFAWDDHALIGFEENMSNFPFWTMRCVLVNVPLNCNSILQRYNWNGVFWQTQDNSDVL
jgi:hypothetical protein